IGGGCGEAEVIEAAQAVLESGRPQVVQVKLTEDPMSWSASICGGVLDVFVEPVYPPEGPNRGSIETDVR
ncbi:XdhC family protein, partial [Gemmatimonadota bacterium]